MKYIITESKLESIIDDYLDELFEIDNLNWTHPYEYDDETEEEGEDETRVEFYIGDYEGEDEGCFRWYDKSYFNDGTEIQQRAPLVQIESEYTKTLDGYFGETWKGPFKKWFKKHFNLPIKDVIN
jgi:hypothetical protein